MLRRLASVRCVEGRRSPVPCGLNGGDILDNSSAKTNRTSPPKALTSLQPSAHQRATLGNKPALRRNPEKGLCKWPCCPRSLRLKHIGNPRALRSFATLL